MTTMTHVKKRDFDPDATVELDGVRLVESEGYLDIEMPLAGLHAVPLSTSTPAAAFCPRAFASVLASEAPGRDLDADSTVEIHPLGDVDLELFEMPLESETLSAAARRLTATAPWHGDSLLCEWPLVHFEPPTPDPTSYWEACRRVLVPFPWVRSVSTLKGAREKLRALAAAAWRGPGVALVERAMSRAFGAVEWLGAVRRRSAPSLRGLLARVRRLARQTRSLAASCRDHVGRAGRLHHVRARAQRLLVGIRAKSLR